MNKKIEFVRETIKTGDTNFEIVVTATETTLLPKRNFTAFSEYVAWFQEEETVFYYLKSKGMFKKVYNIEDEVHLTYKDIESAEIGKNGSMVYLQLSISNEINAFVCKKTPEFQRFMASVSKYVEIIGIETYNKFAQ